MDLHFFPLDEYLEHEGVAERELKAQIYEYLDKAEGYYQRIDASSFVLVYLMQWFHERRGTSYELLGKDTAYAAKALAAGAPKERGRAWLST